ncbi:sam domain containing protein [Stylonychia lemnae]|uniref:Sam domain containing protein n=1 Tax=Stylonychia lemnae TaxID=5949 RepID=A0A078B9Z5_STYLE|nr:sam domain containing protein [Stylonychia lemnae]|eukprot:CDW91239.1 sam domain containing protein [Stylonychia lemnae]
MKNTSTSFGNKTGGSLGNTANLPKSLLNKKNLKPSDVMIEETKMMEDRLEMIKKVMEQEKEKRDQMKQSNQGTMWRSATTKQTINGYSQMVLQHHKQKQPNLPPTTLILKDDESENRNTQKQTNKGMKGFINTQTLKKEILTDSNNSQASMQTQISASIHSNQPLAAANNLSKALQDQNDQFHEVDEFLKELNMLKYKDTFLDNGVEDMEIILELDEKHLEQMSIPLGHKLKILKKIKEVRKDRGLSVPDSRQGERQHVVKHQNLVSSETNTNTTMTTSFIDTSQPRKEKKKVAFADEPNVMTGGVGTDNQDKVKKVNNASSDTSTGNTLLEGDYDEQAAHNQFLEALNAWRNAGKKKEEPTNVESADNTNNVGTDNNSSTPVIKSEDQIQNKESSPPKKKNFLLNLGEDDDKGWVMDYNFAQFEEKEILPDEGLQDTRYAKKESCWNCYKMFPNTGGTADPVSQRQNTVVCNNANCKKKINKSMASYLQTKWYCNGKCVDLESKRDLGDKSIEFYKRSGDSEEDVGDDDFTHNSILLVKPTQYQNKKQTFSVIEIHNQSDYQCYQQLVFPQAPYSFRQSGNPTISDRIQDSPQCQYFVVKNNNSNVFINRNDLLFQNVFSSYSKSINDLFKGSQNLTNFSIIIDNTNLIWKIQNDYQIRLKHKANENNLVLLANQYGESADFDLDQFQLYSADREGHDKYQSNQSRRILYESPILTEDNDNSQLTQLEALQPIQLRSSIKVVYNVSDKYFILTVTFASLIVVLIAVLITIVVLYKRKRQEYKNFLKHKEKKMKGDYKKYEYLDGENETNQEGNNQNGQANVANKNQNQSTPQKIRDELNTETDDNVGEVRFTTQTNNNANNNNNLNSNALRTLENELDQMSFQKNNNEYLSQNGDDQGYYPKQYVRKQLQPQNQYRLIGSNQNRINDFNSNAGRVSGMTAKLKQAENGGDSSNQLTRKLTRSKNNPQGIYYIDDDSD